MANNFTKTEAVAFDAMVAGYEDALAISDHVSKYGTDGELMERSNDTFWRPVPPILTSKDRTIGTDVTPNDVKLLSVPSSLGYKKVVPWKLSATELRDQLVDGKLEKAAAQRAASDINTAIRDVISLQGTIVSAISGAAGDYDDIATCESLMDEMGIMADMRYLGLTTRDYNGMAGNLAGRATMTGKPTGAYEKSYVGRVANFETFKIDAGKRLGANAATVTIATNGAQVRYVPLAAESTTAGEINVDNRYQTVTVSTTSGVTAGDAFTIAGIEAVHHITKESTGQLKTFRVISVDDGTTMTISPPMIGANSSPTAPELHYQNINVASTSATASITFLNDTATGCNPFWHKSSIELLMGRYAVEAGNGAAVLRSTTKQGLELVLTKQFNPGTFETDYFLDAFFGVVNLCPEMNGVLFFNQS